MRKRKSSIGSLNGAGVVDLRKKIKRKFRRKSLGELKFRLD